MKGLELSKKYFEEYGKPMLNGEFSEILKYIAVGFVGSGSDRYGFDDEISRDHDFEAGFCIFLPSEDIVDRRTAFLLERAYSKLPKEFLGVKRENLSPVGGNRNGVIRTEDFYLSAIGEKNGNLSEDMWLTLPDYALAEATNGEIFFDNYGEFTKIREKIKNMPTDIKLKRLAGNILLMAQSGQYNYLRTVKHNEFEAAQLCLNEFVNASLKVVFLLNNKYMPYYKWSFRALKQIENTEEIYENLSFLLIGDNKDKDILRKKESAIEFIAREVIKSLAEKGYSTATENELEAHAYSVNSQIKDSNIRNKNIFCAI